MASYDAPATFRGQLQRGRGAAVRRSAAEAGAADAVYECVITDTRWDRQVDQRDSYLAGLIHRLGLPLAPIEQHLAAFDGADAEPISLALQVLALLPFTGRTDAAGLLRRYVAEGRHWREALEAIGGSGSLKVPEVWDGLADDVLGGRDDAQLEDAVSCAAEPWTTLAQTQPRIRRLLDQATASRRQARKPGTEDRPKRETGDVPTAELVRRIATGGPARRKALEELGRRGDPLILDLAEDASLRNPAGWTPGMPRAVHHLGRAAVPRARAWITSDSMLAVLGERVLSEHGDDRDIPALRAALRRCLAGGDWCTAEIPARGLGRLRAKEAADDLVAAWETTAHSLAREAFLDGLLGCAPRIAAVCAEEGRYDCEPAVQRIACAAAATRGP